MYEAERTARSRGKRKQAASGKKKIFQSVARMNLSETSGQKHLSTPQFLSKRSILSYAKNLPYKLQTYSLLSFRIGLVGTTGL